MAKNPEPLKLPVHSDDDVRMKIYNEIGRTHKQIVEARWRARTAGKPMDVNPGLVLHCEQAVAFLAEEVLRLGVAMERLSATLGKQ